MSAYMHSALRYRITVPAWLIAIALAAVLALGAVALLDGSAQPAPTASAAQPTRTTLPQQDTVCVDSRVVGHC